MYAPNYWNCYPPVPIPALNAGTADDCQLVWSGWGPASGIFALLANEPSTQVMPITTAVEKAGGAVVMDATNVYWADATYIGRVAR